MTEKKSISKVVIWQTCATFLIQGMSLFTTPIFTRMLSTEDYGQTATFGSWTSIIGLIVGLQVSGSIGMAKTKYDENNYRKYCSSILWLSFISFILVLVSFVLFRNKLHVLLGFPKMIIPIIVVYSYALFIISFYNAILEFELRVETETVISIVLAVLTTVLSIYFVANMESEKYIGKIWGMFIPTVIIAIVEFAVVMSKGKTLFCRNYWAFCLPLALPLIFHGAAGTVLAQSDRVMLKSMVGESETGIYSLVYTLATVVDIFWIAFNHAWIPFYYKYKKDKDEHQIKQRSSGYLFTFTIITIGFMLCAPEVFRLIAPEEYWSGLTIIPVVAMAYYINFMYSFPANFEFYHQNTRMISIATVLSAVINIALNYMLIPKYHGIGAAIATLISYVFMFVFHDIAARYFIGDFEYTWRFYLKGLIPVGISFALYYWLMPYAWLRWGTALVLGMILLRRIYKTRSVF